MLFRSPTVRFGPVLGPFSVLRTGPHSSSYRRPHAHTGDRIPPYTRHQPMLPVFTSWPRQKSTITDHHWSMLPSSYFINPAVTELNKPQSCKYGFISLALDIFLHYYQLLCFKIFLASFLFCYGAASFFVIYI